MPETTSGSGDMMVIELPSLEVIPIIEPPNLDVVLILDFYYLVIS